MAYFSSVFGKINLCKNVIKNIDNTQKILYIASVNNGISRVYSSEVETIKKVLNNSPPQPKKKMSKAMKAYLQRAKDYDEFIKTEISKYQIGKRHLANMMGENPDTFTQADINSAIKYLFPSGLYEKRAHPIMREPLMIFPPRKDAEFDIEGRPFHSMFYTIKPNYYSALYDIVEQIEQLDKFENEQLSKGLLPLPTNKANLLGSQWWTYEQMKKKFLEPIREKDYDDFVAAGEKLANHPYSANVNSFLMLYRNNLKAQTHGLVIPPLKYDNNGRPFILVPNVVKKSTRGTVKVLGNGTGKITINGYDITFFDNIQHREQVVFPLIFTGMDDKVDVEANVYNGGPTGYAGAIRWGISWALRSFVDLAMVEKMRLAGLLTKDIRKRERKKPGQEGARRKFTWKKR